VTRPTFARRVFLALSERREGRDVRRPRRVSELLEDCGEAHQESIGRIEHALVELGEALDTLRDTRS